MAILTVTFTVPAWSTGDMNYILTDAANPQAGVVQLEKLIDGFESGTINGTVALAVTGGNSVTYNLS